ncbi:MAG: ATP-binding protein [Steroidobacteraceae bacterium]
MPDEPLLQDVFDLAPIGMYVVDAGFRLVAANPLACAVFGDTGWIGRDFSELIRTLWPEPYASYLLQRFRHTLETGEAFEHGEHSEERRDRHRVEHYKWRIHRTLHHGQPVVICYFRDITERVLAFREVRRQQEELQTTLDLIPIGVGIARDPLANEITPSPRLAQMLGLGAHQNASLSGADGPVGRFHAVRDGQVVPPEELPLQRAARTGTEQRDVELDLHFPDGRVLNLLVSAAPLFHPDGRVRGAIASHVDVSALKSIQRALEAADRQKDEFLAMLAHELRNPLAPLRSAAELLRRVAPADGRQQSAAEVITRQVGVLSRLVEDLLDISRITQGQIELRIERVALGPLIDMAIESVTPLMRERRHELVSSVPTGEILVDGDATRLVQCLVNLLTNAAKYTDSGGHIALSLGTDAGKACVAVSDDGAGIAPEFLPRIFELFSQSASTLHRAEGGLGIGLALVRRLIELHGGSVSCQSEGTGKGSRFEIRLPIA